MQRARVDPECAAEAVEAVRSGRMTLRAAAKTFDTYVGSLQKRVRCSVSIAGRVGPGTVLSPAEENSISDMLKFAAACQLGLNRVNSNRRSWHSAATTGRYHETRQ
ncbi:unnamed protein product [Sphacelaria rigidula]